MNSKTKMVEAGDGGPGEKESWSGAGKLMVKAGLRHFLTWFQSFWDYHQGNLGIATPDSGRH